MDELIGMGKERIGERRRRKRWKGREGRGLGREDNWGEKEEKSIV